MVQWYDILLISRLEVDGRFLKMPCHVHVCHLCRELESLWLCSRLGRLKTISILLPKGRDLYLFLCLHQRFCQMRCYFRASVGFWRDGKLVCFAVFVLYLPYIYILVLLNLCVIAGICFNVCMWDSVRLHLTMSQTLLRVQQRIGALLEYQIRKGHTYSNVDSIK